MSLAARVCPYCATPVDADPTSCGACYAPLEGAPAPVLPALDLAVELPARSIAPGLTPPTPGSVPPQVSFFPLPSVSPAPLVHVAPPPRSLPPSGFSDRFLFDTPLVNGAALPAAFAFGALLHLVGLGGLVQVTVVMWFHELGHAITAWFSGFVAVPLPFITVWPTDDRNVIVVLLIAAAWLGLGAFGVRKKRWALVGAAAVMALVQARMTLFMSPGRAFQWVLFAGLGGELLLASSVMLAFYQRLPWRWDFWRYPLLLGAAATFFHALFRWIGIPFGWAQMPSGAALGEKSDGDVERLIRSKEFTEQALARTYLVVALLCAVALAAAYAVYLQRARRRAALGIGPDDDDDLAS